MSADLMGIRFSGREPAWHGAAKRIWGADKPTASEAVTFTDMDYELVKVRTSVVNPWGDDSIALDDFAILRQPVADDNVVRSFGYVKESYEPLRNGVIARILDPLTEQWPMESIGALGHGEIAFFVLDAGEVEIAGEESHSYFTVVDHKDGKGRLHALYTPVRMVCRNTYEMGMAAATTNVQFNHYADVLDDLKWTAALMQNMRDSQQRVIGALNALAEQPIALEQAAEIVNAAFPLPRKSGRVLLAEDLKLLTDADAPAAIERLGGATSAYQRRLARHGEYREQTMALYEKFNDEFPRVAGTAYAAVNAVIELVDHRERRGAGFDAMFGEGRQAKGRAYQAAIALN